MILTLPVLLYQLLFVLIMFIASRFGRAAMMVALVACLLWTATHLFLVPLAVLQTGVIVGSFMFFRRRLTTNRAESTERKPLSDK